MIEKWIEQLGSGELVERLTAENAVIVAGQSAESRLIDCLGSENKEQRFRAAYALGDIGSRTALERIYPLLNDPIWDVRAGAAYALGMIGDAAAFDTLAQVALSPNPDEQTPYVAALGLLRLDPVRARPILQNAATDTTEQIRRTAMSALATDHWT